MSEFCHLRCLEGDTITVYSAGHLLGHGTFLRIDGRNLIWFDRRGNMNFTDLRVSSIRKERSFFPDHNDLNDPL
ncbi:hypothetical protein [Bacillus thuringiensis]|uniref:hypothetical protein n=1 Tax=Bacillus thuringiensis TaxID=1428 RepID=UPI0011A4C5EA|nr:hypothetical protein [Bacillus thuringiensis]